MNTLGKSIDAAIDNMPDDFELKSFLTENIDEVKDMLFTEFAYDQIYDKAERLGHAEGIMQNRERVASDMLKDSEPLAKILKYSRLPENTIRNLAHSLGLTIQQ